MLEERYLSEEERKGSIFLPNELRIHFYMYFPEHGLNQANNCQELAGELAKIANSRIHSNGYKRIMSLEPIPYSPEPHDSDCGGEDGY